MNKAIAGALLLCSTLLVPQLGSAAVFMCVDPETGKKTFTDRACADTGQGKKVRVEPTNFGSGTANQKADAAWASQKDVSVAGRDNLTGNARHINSARNTSLTAGS